LLTISAILPIDRYLKHARKQFDKQNYSTAASSYKKAYRYAKNEFTVRDFYQTGFAYKAKKKYTDSIIWFQRALQNNYKDTGTLIYQMATAYSLAKDKKNAQKYLRMAINHGLGYINEIEKNKELNFIVKQSDWKKYYSSLKKISPTNYTREDMISILSMSSKEKGNHISTMLCDSGRVIQSRYKDSCFKGFLLGNWNLYGGRIILKFDKECNIKGLGSKKKAKKTDKNLTCDGNTYRHHTATCKPNVEKFNIANHYIKDARAGKKPSIKWFNTNYSIEFKPLGADPKQCNAGFKPKKVKDMNIE